MTAVTTMILRFAGEAAWSRRWSVQSRGCVDLTLALTPSSPHSPVLDAQQDLVVQAPAEESYRIRLLLEPVRVDRPWRSTPTPTRLRCVGGSCMLA